MSHHLCFVQNSPRGGANSEPMTLTDAIFEQLDLEHIEENLFRGFAQDHGADRVFGGQVIGQALIAAGRTVKDRPCHSLHVYFLRPGDPKIPILYEVDRIRDGGSFTTRRVVATQKGEAIFSMSASFQSIEHGLEHQIEMPDVPGPEELPTEEELLERLLIDFPEVDESLIRLAHGERPLDVRRVQDFNYFKPKVMPPVKHIWYRSKIKLGNDLTRHQCLLAYASDVGFLSTSNMPHGKSFMSGLMLASIDHSLWFHRAFNLEDWILIAMESTLSAGSRGFVRASMFTRDGTLIGSATQEGLIRDIGKLRVK